MIRLVEKWSNLLTRERVEYFLLSTYVRITNYLSTVNVNEDALNSLYLGLTIGICVVTYLVIDPGEPTVDYTSTSEEEALDAIKRKLYEQDEAGTKKSSSKQQKEVAEDEELEELERKINELENKGTKSKRGKQMDAPTKDLGESNPSTTKRSSSSSSTSELVDQATLKRLEKFEKLKLERRKEVDAEADLFLDELKQRGISKEKFKQMLPKDMELDEIKERGKKPWILTILNYLLPVGLIVFVVYILQRDLSISIPGVIKTYFPREAEVFEQIFTGVATVARDAFSVD